MHSVLRFGILLATVAWISPATAGVVFEIETTDHAQSRVVNTKVIAQGDYLKMTSAAAQEVRSAPPTTMIFNAERRELIIVDDRTKTYSMLDDDGIEAMADRIKAMRFESGAATDQMREALDKVPKEQRAMMEKMMKERMGSPTVSEPEAPTPLKTDIRKTKMKKTQHGFATTRHDVYRDKQRVSELWVTSWDKIEGGQKVASLFAEMAGFMNEMTAKLSRDSGSPGMGNNRSNNNVFEHMKELGGFPVVSRVLEGDDIKSESILRSTKLQDIDAATFQPPEGYTLRSLIAPAQPPQDHSGHDH